MRNKSITVTKKWKRFMAVCCSHGEEIDKRAEAAVLRFRRDYKPDTVIHLGDAVDLPSLRSGAKGTKDESKRPGPDVEAGLDFIEKLRPHYWCFGNHEDRPCNLVNSPNGNISHCAQVIVNAFEETAEKIGCIIVPYKYKQRVVLGGWKFFHGTYFSENACRDHAEAFGNCIFGHTHRVGVAKGRRDDNPTGVCVGTLADIPCMDYAKSRRATLSWSQGFAFGEYTDTRLVCWLHEQPQGQREWRLPI